MFQVHVKELFGTAAGLEVARPRGTSKRWAALWMQLTVILSVSMLRNAPEAIRRQLQLNADSRGIHAFSGAVQAHHGVHAAAD